MLPLSMIRCWAVTNAFAPLTVPLSVPKLPNVNTSLLMPVPLKTRMLFAPLRPLKSKLTAAATESEIEEANPPPMSLTSAPVPAVGVSNVTRPLSISRTAEFWVPRVRWIVEISFLTSWINVVARTYLKIASHRGRAIRVG